MAAKSSQGYSSEESELRIVILGNAEDDKNKVVKSVLNCENLTGVKVGQCTLHQRDQDGRRISVVDAPGWDRSSKQQTPEKIKQEVDRSMSLCPSESIEKEVERSMSLCPPGPHALLLVIPVKALSTHELTAAQAHVEMLSERVWKHTILLFACDEGVEETQINEHIRSAENILGKCGGRYCVLQKRAWESPAQIHQLIKKIEDLVEENGGDFFTQAELIPHTTQEASGKSLRQRQGSLDNPPNLNKDKGDSVEKKETRESDKPLEDIPKICMDVKQFVVIMVLILMGVVGALIGAVAGAENGVSGSCTGLFFGVVVGILLASISMCIYTHIYSRSYPKKPTHRTS